MISRLQLRGERECIAATLFSPTVYEVATARAKIANYIVVTRFQIRLVVRFHVWQVIFHIYAGSELYGKQRSFGLACVHPPRM